MDPRISCWTPDAVAAIAATSVPALPVLGRDDVVAAVPGLDLWDMWPLQYADGRTATIDGGALWLVLSAPAGADPGARHDIARIRLLHHKHGAWHDCGNALPDGLNPGSREWAGSAVVDAAHRTVTLYYTASGRRGEARPTFEQRLFATTGRLDLAGVPRIVDWSDPIEQLSSDGDWYVIAAEAEGQPGHIKAFRDPAFFHDPATGQDYLLFTGSLGRSQQAFNGTIGIAEVKGGIAKATGGGWTLLPPLISADGVNNELERPHVIARNGLYYVFWSTQRRTFAPDGPSGPNGLYGMVAPALFGPYQPLNGTGLVAANPAAEPCQAYSWWVLDTLEVVSFVDHWGLQGRSFEDHPEMLRGQFGGTPAPRFTIALEGDITKILNA